MSLYVQSRDINHVYLPLIASSNLQVYIYLAESGQKVELGAVRSDVSTVGPYSFSRDDIASKTKQYIIRYVYFISNNRLVRAREDNMMDTKV